METKELEAVCCHAELEPIARPIISADKYYRALTLIGHISPRIDAYTNAHEQPLITNNATNAHHL